MVAAMVCAAPEVLRPCGDSYTAWSGVGAGSPHSLVDVVRVHACYRFSMAVRTFVKNVILI